MASIASEQQAGAGAVMAGEPARTQRRWRDRKRYAWLLGLVVPHAAVLRLGAGRS